MFSPPNTSKIPIITLTLAILLTACTTTPKPVTTEHPTNAISDDTTCPISGNLELKTPRDILQFSELACPEIHGDLSIDNTLLTDLNGLKTVHGTLWIAHNPDITAITAISNLNHVGQNLIIVNNPALATIQFPHLQTINQTLWIGENLSLTQLAPFTSLQKIGRDIRINDNPTLTSENVISDLTNITQNHPQK